MIYLSGKTKIVLGVILLMLSIALAIGAIFWADNLDHSTYDYSELIYKENYTIDNFGRQRLNNN